MSQRQLAMVMDLNKCIGCQTCTVACKTQWTNRNGREYMYWNNVETYPGTGYPKNWMELGGGFDEAGDLQDGIIPNIEADYGVPWDYGQVVVSTDLEEWEVLADFTWEAEYWDTAVVDLSEYAGQTIALAFYAYSDGSGTRLGWYIDDVELTDNPSAEPINKEQGQYLNSFVKKLTLSFQM